MLNIATLLLLCLLFFKVQYSSVCKTKSYCSLYWSGEPYGPKNRFPSAFLFLLFFFFLLFLLVWCLFVIFYLFIVVFVRPLLIAIAGVWLECSRLFYFCLFLLSSLFFFSSGGQLQDLVLIHSNAQGYFCGVSVCLCSFADAPMVCPLVYIAHYCTHCRGVCT